MGNYNNFEQYLEINYHFLLEKSLYEFINSKKIYEYDSSLVNYEKISLNKFNIIGVKFIQSESNIVRFKVFLDVYINVDRNKQILKKTFYTTMSGKFNKGFTINKDNPIITEEKIEGTYTKKLVPVINKDNYDKYAKKFLKHFFPEALEKPTKIDLSKLNNKDGMKFYEIPLEEGVLGKTYFADDVVKYVDKNGECHFIDVKPGTILINSLEHQLRGNGAYRNTVIHEVVHWFYHRNYFELLQLLDNSKTCSVCYRSEYLSNNNEIEWMELQARELAPRILMYGKSTKNVFNDFLKKYNEIALLSPIKVIGESIKDFAKFYDVSLLSAKYRLKELGFSQVDGSYNFIGLEGKKYNRPYLCDENSLSEYQTFFLDLKSYQNLLESNSEIKELINQSKLIYSDGLIVINNSKYFDFQKQKLTDYARSHVEECCLIFNTYRFDEPKKNSNTRLFLFSTNSTRKVYADIDKTQMLKVISLYIDDNNHYQSHKSKIPIDFAGTLEYHYKKAGYTSKIDFSENCDINSKDVGKFFKGEKTPSFQQTIKMCITLKLSLPYTEDMLYKAQHSFDNFPNSTILKTIIMSYGRSGITTVYKALKEAGKEELLGYSEKYKKEFNLF